MKSYYSLRNSLLLTEKHTTFGSFKFLTYLKKRLYWQLRSLHRGTAPGSFLRWLLSADAYAVAARRAFLDYLMRRFGRINSNSAQVIQKALGAGA